MHRLQPDSWLGKSVMAKQSELRWARSALPEVAHPEATRYRSLTGPSQEDFACWSEATPDYNG